MYIVMQDNRTHRRAAHLRGRVDLAVHGVDRQRGDPAGRLDALLERLAREEGAEDRDAAGERLRELDENLRPVPGLGSMGVVILMAGKVGGYPERVVREAALSGREGAVAVVVTAPSRPLRAASRTTRCRSRSTSKRSTRNTRRRGRGAGPAPWGEAHVREAEAEEQDDVHCHAGQSHA
jgi:hypothetical protein